MHPSLYTNPSAPPGSALLQTRSTFCLTISSKPLENSRLVAVVMEAAGVALGGIPLILIALEKYAKVTRILKDYADYETTLNRLQINLWIQEEQYDETMESVGLRDMSLGDVEIHLRQRHPQKCDKFLGIVKQIDVITKTITGMLDVGSPEKVGMAGNEHDTDLSRDVKLTFMAAKVETRRRKTLQGGNAKDLPEPGSGRWRVETALQ